MTPVKKITAASAKPEFARSSTAEKKIPSFHCPAASSHEARESKS